MSRFIWRKGENSAMESNLTLALDAVASSGFIIPTEQRAALHLSLSIKKRDAALSTLSLLGRVFTSNGKDYLLARGCNDIRKIDGRLVFDTKHYYSQNGVQWLDLQPLADDLYKACKTIRGCFSGEPDRVYTAHLQPEPQGIPEGVSVGNEVSGEETVGDEAPVEGKGEGTEETTTADLEETAGEVEVIVQDDAEEEDEQKEDGMESRGSLKPPAAEQLNIGELDRLSALIKQLDYECGVVPMGAFTLDASKQLVKNIYFPGIEFMDKLDSYAHLFQGYEEAPLSNDIRGSWSIEVIPMSNDVLLKSLYWPGYVFYYSSSTKDFGSMYFGIGEKNHDLAFMI